MVSMALLALSWSSPFLGMAADTHRMGFVFIHYYFLWFALSMAMCAIQSCTVKLMIVRDITSFSLQHDFIASAGCDEK